MLLNTFGKAFKKKLIDDDLKISSISRAAGLIPSNVTRLLKTRALTDNCIKLAEAAGYDVDIVLIPRAINAARVAASPAADASDNDEEAEDYNFFN